MYSMVMIMNNIGSEYLKAAKGVLKILTGKNKFVTLYGDRQYLTVVIILQCIQTSNHYIV